MEQFPRKPFYDRVIVRETPIEEYYQQPENIAIDLQNAKIRIKSDRGVVVAVGAKVEEALVGDTVFFDEFALCDRIYLNPGDAVRTDLPVYWQIREADLKGYDVAARSNTIDGSMYIRSLELDLEKYAPGLTNDLRDHFKIPHGKVLSLNA